MFRTLIIIAVGFSMGYLVGHKDYNTKVTYNTLGRKTVISSEFTLQDAVVAVGQVCQEDGYTIISKERSKDGFILTVECTKKESEQSTFLF